MTHIELHWLGILNLAKRRLEAFRLSGNVMEQARARADIQLAESTLYRVREQQVAA